MNLRFTKFKIVICLIFSIVALNANALSSKVKNFDFWGFQAKFLLEGRLVSSSKAEAALATRGLKVANSGRGAVIVNVEGKKFFLELINSETEGFFFVFSDLPEDIKQIQEQAKGYPTLVSEKTLSKKEWGILSSSDPSLELGVTTPNDLVKVLGKPDHTGPDYTEENQQKRTRWVWVLKRDYEKEKSCYGKIEKNSSSAAMQIVFSFDTENKLRKISFINSISGEC